MANPFDHAFPALTNRIGGPAAPPPSAAPLFAPTNPVGSAPSMAAPAPAAPPMPPAPVFGGLPPPVNVKPSGWQLAAMIPALLAGIKDPVVAGAAVAGLHRGLDEKQARLENVQQQQDRRAGEQAKFYQDAALEASKIDDPIVFEQWRRSITPMAKLRGIDPAVFQFNDAARLAKAQKEARATIDTLRSQHGDVVDDPAWQQQYSVNGQSVSDIYATAKLPTARNKQGQTALLKSQLTKTSGSLEEQYYNAIQIANDPTKTPAERAAAKTTAEQLKESANIRDNAPTTSKGSIEQQYFDAMTIASDPAKTPAERATAKATADRLKQSANIRDNPAPGSAPVTVRPGSAEYKVAQDLAYGKLTISQFRSLYSYSRDTNAKIAIYNMAQDLNPNFNPAAFELGYTLAKNPRVQQQLASMDNVIQAVPDLLKFSDAAKRSGVPLLNDLINKAGYQLGGKQYSNLALARTAFADELSGALGFGSATDMSREMGFDMTDKNLSPDAFASGVQEVVLPFIDRKRGTLLQQMGIYGTAAFNPAAQAAGGGGGFNVTDPNGKVHPFKTQAEADAFKKLMAGAK